MSPHAANFDVLNLETLVFEIEEEIQCKRNQILAAKREAMSEEKRERDKSMPDVIGAVCDHLIRKLVGEYSRDPQFASEKFIIDIVAVIIPRIYELEQCGDDISVDNLCCDLVFFYEECLGWMAPPEFLDDECAIEDPEEFESYMKDQIREVLEVLMPQWKAIKRAADRLIRAAAFSGMNMSVLIKAIQGEVV